jgi:GWxTD domain-containing protein
VRALLLLGALAGSLCASAPTWLDLVQPVITPAEKKTWLALSPVERAKFEESFWADKSISAQEYFRRVAYADATWGGPKRGSSANTDPGRVYIALGPPNKVVRFPSSRIFVTLEIWYYNTVPGVLNTELRLTFFRRNNVNPLELYSPTNDTIRALLLNESGTRTMFAPNDIIDVNAIRQNLNVPPAEDEIISAAVNVATGIRDVGNEEILGEVSSPRLMLTRKPKTSVESRLILDRPKLDFVLSPSAFGGTQVDLWADLKAGHDITVEFAEGESATVYRNTLKLSSGESRSLRYLQRIDLLPGSYRVFAEVDGHTFPYSLEVPAQLSTSGIVRASEGHATAHTPFEFGDTRLYPDEAGRYAFVTLPRPGEVRWSIRQKGVVVWRQTTSGKDAAVLTLPFDRLRPGRYRLDADTEDDSKSIDLDLGATDDERVSPLLLSYNANLAPAAREAQIGHEWLLRGRVTEARQHIESALASVPIRQAQIDLARIDVMAGHWDEARTRIRSILADDPQNFEALCVLAFIETGLQDYTVAAQLYQRALAIENSPTIRMALAKLPQH